MIREMLEGKTTKEKLEIIQKLNKDIIEKHILENKAYTQEELELSDELEEVMFEVLEEVNNEYDFDFSDEEEEEIYNEVMQDEFMQKLMKHYNKEENNMSIREILKLENLKEYIANCLDTQYLDKDDNVVGHGFSINENVNIMYSHYNDAITLDFVERDENDNINIIKSIELDEETLEAITKLIEMISES